MPCFVEDLMKTVDICSSNVSMLCWRLMNMEDIRAELVKCQSGVDTINKIWELERSKQLKVIVFLWRWWSAKNKANEGGRRQSENEIYNFVCYYLLEFEKLEGCWHRIAPTHSNALERAGDCQNDLNQRCPGRPVWPVPQTSLTGVEQRTAKT